MARRKRRKTTYTNERIITLEKLLSSVKYKYPYMLADIESELEEEYEFLRREDIMFKKHGIVKKKIC